LREGLCAAANREHAWLFSTGRAAMTVAFEAMKRASGDSRRTEVIIPGYTCYSVPAAVERAGLVPRLCDVDPSTLSPDLGSVADLDYGRVLAIVSANLYGLPNALTDIEDLARRRSIFMLDDAAQALGAKLGTRPAGGFGDVGLFSFDKGKNITTLQGGALAAHSGPLQESIESMMCRIGAPRVAHSIATVVKLTAYAILLQPGPYSVVRRLPLGLGLTPYETDYPIVRFSLALTGVATRQLERLADINGTRVANAGRLGRALADIPDVTVPKLLPAAVPVYARYPVLMESGQRAGVIAALERSGIGATASYPKALADVPEVVRRLPRDQRPTPGAQEVAKRIVTLPTHGYSPADLSERIAAVIRGVPATGCPGVTSSR
jgi:dTDP-4-amino-4,6-dideoxygalactose transaminase